MSEEYGRPISRWEPAKRAAILAIIVITFVSGLWAFHTRQSLVTQLNPYLVTRVMVPAAQLNVRPVSMGTRSAQGIPVLVYHGIVPKAESCNITPETFREHMTALKEAGYTTLTMDEFAEYMSGSRTVPERSVLITFDDGRTDSFSGADPVLKRLGFHATMFSILTNVRSRKAFYLTPAETKMMSDSGRWDVQSHTNATHVFADVDSMGNVGHALASRRWNTALGRLESDAEYLSRIRDDLTEAKSGLSEMTGKPIIAFAYPWGDDGSDSGDPLIRENERLITASLYPYTFKQASPTLDENYNYPSDRGRVLRRISIGWNTSAADVMAQIERGKPKALPFQESVPFASSGWALNSGAFAPSDDGRELVSLPQARNPRGDAFLDGSRNWEDYVLSSKFALEGTETVSMVARRVGPRDYVAATISRSYVSIEQVVDNKTKTIGEADVGLVADGTTPHAVSLRVEGRALHLQIDGKTIIVIQNLDPSLSTGGIGFRIDPSADGSARLKLTDVTVSPLTSLISQPGAPVPARISTSPTIAPLAQRGGASW